MGAAAYNRGSESISRSIFGRQPCPANASIEAIIARLNSIPSGRSTIAAGFRTVIRRLETDAGTRWVLMNREMGGFASFGFEYPLLDAVFRDWALVCIGYGLDEHSSFFFVTSRP